MKFVVAMDSMKGCLSSMEAGLAVARGLRRVFPRAEILVKPLADGGEGTVEALTQGGGGTIRTCSVTGPLGTPVTARYGIIGATAIVEMAQAAGLPLVPPEARDPLYTTTYGVGQLLRDAIGQGCREFLVGIGGSATNDGGVGMLQALGFGFFDRLGREIPRGAVGLEQLASIDRSTALPQLDRCRFRVACDVTNPLCGPLGASAVFAPQKGAKARDLPRLDRALSNFARHSGADPEVPGAGAAGGLGYGFLAYTHAVLEPGVDIVLSQVGLAQALAGAALLFTGEGRLDGQTAMGKAPAGAARLAKALGVGVVALAGSVGPDAEACNDAGIDAYFPILQTPGTLEEAMDPATARQNLERTAAQAARLWSL